MGAMTPPTDDSGKADRQVVLLVPPLGSQALEYATGCMRCGGDTYGTVAR